jgi:hypothetical protein
VHGRVVHQHVEPAEVARQGLAQRVHALGVGHIDLARVHPEALAAQLRGGGFTLVGIASAENGGEAVLCQPAHHLAADPSVGPGHQGNAALSGHGAHSTNCS